MALIDASGLSKKQRKRLRMFLRQGGKCHWCGGRMFFSLGQGGSFHDDEATIEHLDHRYSPERGKHPGEYRLAATHNRCNRDFAKRCEQSVGIDELRRRSRHHHA